MNDKKESTEDYLEKILMLKEKGDLVRSIDLANFMSFSKASVSIALRKLRDEGFVTVNEETGEIDLTPSGSDLANATYNRHKMISKAFIALGVSEDTALKDACRIEHDISEETFEAIIKHYQKEMKKREAE